jgi:hypothetical protein
MPYDQANRRRGAPSRETVVVGVGGTLGVDLPSVGLGMPTRDAALSEHETELVTALRPAHLRADLHLAAPDWRTVLERACSSAISTATGLELALYVGPDPEGELEALTAALPVLQARVVRFVVLREGRRAVDPSLVQLARRSLATAAPKAFFAGGSARADVGRAPDALEGDDLDAVVCSLAATMDPDDGRSPMETAVAHGEAVRSLQELRPGRPVVVTPVTMGGRPHDEAAASPSEAGPRLWSLSGAAWTLASLASLARAGAQSITYLEASGPRGLLSEEGAASRPGTVSPLYHVLADVLEWDFGQVGESESSAPLDVAVLCAHTLDGQRILLANLTNEPRRCSVGRLSGQVRVRTLDDSSVVTACHDPARFRAQSRQRQTRDGALELELGPYAYVRVNV